MTDAAAKLLLWLSPSFPTGGFAYSQGLEWAVAAGWVADEAALVDWLEASTRRGALWTELVLLSMTRRAETAALPEIAALAAAHQPSAERAAEATALGTAFRDAYLAAWRPSAGSAFDALGRAPVALAVAVGVAAREHALALRATLDAFAAAQLSNQISAVIRLGVVGQIAGQRISAALLEPAAEACALAETAGEDDLGGASWGADLASMLHEEQQPRLFRS